MLEDKVIISIRETMEADLRPRDQPLSLLAEGADRKWRRSGNSIHERAEIGCTELSARANIIWDGIRRCYAAYQKSAAEESIVSALNQQLQYWISGESDVIVRRVDASWAPEQARGEIPRRIALHRDDLLKKYHNEARFYVHALMNPPQKPEQSNTINVQTNYGAIAAGSDAHAQVHIAGNAQLIQALEQLRASFEQTPSLTPDQRGDSLGVIADAISAAREPKPNRLKLWGLLKGVGVAVSSLADAPGAWDSVRAAASLIGIDLG